MKWFKPVYIVFIFVTIIFLTFLVNSLKVFLIIYNFEDLATTFWILTYKSVFTSFCIALFPMFAVFFKHKISWFTILLYFYFLAAFLFYILAYYLTLNSSLNIEDSLIIIGAFSIPMISIYILNRADTFLKVYAIKREKLSLYNLIAFILGCGISVIVYIMHNRGYYDIF